MIKIGAFIPNVHDATNWYRGTGPLAAIRKRTDMELEVDLIREWSFATVQMKDIAFFQRPSTPSELEAIRLCKRLHVPVIVDYDDLLFEIPTDNPAHQSYMNDPIQKTIIQIMREADLIWVSTNELKRCIQITEQASLNQRVYVIPNALDDVHLVKKDRRSPPPLGRRSPAVVWRGSPTHQRDVMEFTPEVIEVADSSPKTSFVFVGYNPWFVTDAMRKEQARCSGMLPVGEFMDFLYGTAAQVGMVPLHDSRFNRCKSNIAWLEMTWAGGVVLAPDWEEWRHPGVVTYKNREDFKAGLKTLVEMDPLQLHELNKQSWEHILQNFTLSKTNRKRIHTIEGLLSGEWPDGWQRLSDSDESMVLE